MASATSCTTKTVEIPVIDVSRQNLDAPQQLLAAAARHGFVFVENNEAGIAKQDIDHIFQLSKSLFASPFEVKNACAIASNRAGKNHGWLGRGDETLDPHNQRNPDVKEAFNMGEHVDGKFDQAIPAPLQAHVAEIVRFQDSCHRLCQLILRQFAVALGLDEQWFASRHDRSKGPSGTVFRMLFYPQTVHRDDELDIRAGAHSDYGSITLLFQQLGQPGLQIKTASGKWAAVPVDPSPQSVVTSERGALPILVNIGDLLEDWTAGLLKSTVHRVIFPDEGEDGDRYSIAYFCHPLDDAVLEPVPSAMVEQHAARGGKTEVRLGKVMTAKDHLMQRLAATIRTK